MAKRTLKGAFAVYRDKIIQAAGEWVLPLRRRVLLSSEIKKHVRVVHLDEFGHLFNLFDTGRVRRAGDIGCNKGQYVMAVLNSHFPEARLLGVDPKMSNYNACLKLKTDRIDFKRLDSRLLDEDNAGIFDFVLCYGLIYHLDDPTALMKSLERITHDRSVVNIEGHIAINKEQACLPEPNPPIVSKVLDGTTYYGKIYKEFDPDMSPEQKDEACEAAYDNLWAFWLTYDSIIKMFIRYGFTHIIEVRMATSDISWGPGLYFPSEGRQPVGGSPPQDLRRLWSRRNFLISRSPFPDQTTVGG